MAFFGLHQAKYVDICVQSNPRPNLGESFDYVFICSYWLK
jgi:hypothetical protein